MGGRLGGGVSGLWLGIGFRIQAFFQFFDITGIFAYTIAFILVVFAFEYLVLRPLEGRVLRWRTDQP